MEEKIGRPRDYQFLDFEKPLSGQSIINTLGELRKRAEDQIIDLPLENLDKPFSEQALTIRWLFLHLNWAEMSWLPKITGREPDKNSLRSFTRGKVGEASEQQNKDLSASELVKLSQKHFMAYVSPALSSPIDFNSQSSTNPDLTTGQICSHLFWHWSYHSGQIGLLRLMGGKDYSWRFK